MESEPPLKKICSDSTIKNDDSLGDSKSPSEVVCSNKDEYYNYENFDDRSEDNSNNDVLQSSAFDEYVIFENENKEVEYYSSSDSLTDSDLEVPVDELEQMLEEGLPEELKGNRQVNAKDAAKEFIRKLKEKNIKESNNCNNEEENYLDDSENVQQTDDISANEMVNNEYPNQSNDNSKSEEINDDDSNKAGNKMNDYECRTKTVLEELESNHFDLLPEGWIKLVHKSGMPVYLHRPTRVCTMSRPYYLGSGSVKKHSIPISSIPCLSYKRALENKNKNADAIKENQNSNVFCNVQIETAADNLANQSLDPLQFREYCKQLFTFKTINCVMYKSWVERRKQVKEKKKEDQRQRLTLPTGTKLLRFPIIDPDNPSNSKPNKEWIMNPAGKSYVCILHEYVQHALKKQPSYTFKELENPATPYSATVSINGMHYGTATGASKKLAKLEAARVALEILIPELKNKIDPDDSCNDGDFPSLSIFDKIKIEDPRVAEFCAKTTEPSPYAILLTCLQRNYALTEDVNINYSVNKVENKKNVFTMTIGNHTATVPCKNKREGKQRASQAILQSLHPNLKNWGSLLRLYGNRSVKNVKEKKKEEQEITLLQSKATTNEPNLAILNKLRTEMRKLLDKPNNIRPMCELIPSDSNFTSASGQKSAKKYK